MRMYSSEYSDITSKVLDACRNNPHRTALILPEIGEAGFRGHLRRVSYGDLLERVEGFSRGLVASGLKSEDRLVALLSPSVELFALLLAANRLGLICVLIDPSMGLRRVLWAISHTQPRAIASVRPLLSKWPFLPALWRRQRYCEDGPAWGCRSLASLVRASGPSDNGFTVHADKTALITFTSGTTGRPKGADRTFGVLAAQHEAIEQLLPSRDGDVEMTCFPVVVFHLLACGMTAVFPPVDLRRPATVDGRAVIEEIYKHGVTRLSGAPAFMERVVDAVESTSVQCPSVRLIYVGGAPVTRELCRRISQAFPQADCRVVYGSTEAEPIAGVSMNEVVASTGIGHLVGQSHPMIDLRLVQMPHSPDTLDDRGLDPYLADRRSEGEVVVAGPHVVGKYWNDPAADRKHKLIEPSGKIWHRTGDVGLLDDQDRLWLIGRIADRVRVGTRDINPFPLEERIGQCPGVERAALVVVGRDSEPLVAIERRDGFAQEQTAAAVKRVLSESKLETIKVRFVSKIPMDIRHNSKIDRVRLREFLNRHC